MKLKNKYTDEELENGELRLIGNLYDKRGNMQLEKLTFKNYNEIIAALKNGLPHHVTGNIHQVDKLTFSNIKLPKNVEKFQGFIRSLIQLNTLKELRFSQSSFAMGIILQPTFLEVFLEELKQNTSITHLGISVSDTQASSETLAALATSEIALRELYVGNLTDDLYEYTFLKSLLANRTHNIEKLSLGCTCRPFNIRRDLVTNRKLMVQFGRSDFLELNPPRATNEPRFEGETKRGRKRGCSSSEDRPPSKKARVEAQASKSGIFAATAAKSTESAVAKEEAADLEQTIIQSNDQVDIEEAQAGPAPR